MTGGINTLLILKLHAVLTSVWSFQQRYLIFLDGVSSSKVCGAHVRDRLTGKEWDIKAKSVVNATGPFTDIVREMGNENKKICQPSIGTHIVLPEYYW